jgi:hypothetical protein
MTKSEIEAEFRECEDGNKMGTTQTTGNWRMINELLLL